MNTFRDKNILVVGGAGFVGSNLVNLLLKEKTKKILIVDNLLSSDISNVPEDDEVEFLFGSITNDKILEKIPEGLDYVFHLACYHGNQSSIADPIADHENNSLTTLKLLERLKHIKSIKKIVYA
ncbi:MAG: NAD-dependent epimerase/dehydratase family protein, partial [Alphaproteobacteria bacterium]|nr:NAD-dependent epimerase/dehydratase family protein [Alphaproteobacteria bacterium]